MVVRQSSKLEQSEFDSRYLHRMPYSSMVEQIAHNDEATGSNPVEATKGGEAQMAVRQLCKLMDVGSMPITSTK